MAINRRKPGFHVAPALLVLGIQILTHSRAWILCDFWYADLETGPK